MFLMASRLTWPSVQRAAAASQCLLSERRKTQHQYAAGSDPRHAASHGELGARDVMFIVGSQQYLYQREFGRLARPFHQYGFAKILDFVGRHRRREERRPDQSGCDTVCPNTLVSE